MTIIELHEMIDLTNRFFLETSHKMLMLGGMVGSHPLSHVLDVATEIVRFDEILILEGCEDFCYIPKKPVPNYIPYAQVFVDLPVSGVLPYDTFEPKLWETSCPTIKAIDQDYIRQYDVIIVNNAHLIDPSLINMIASTAKWKCILIGDPFDIGGEPFTNFPTIIDCLEKQSPIIGMARKLYGISTYAIDKKAPGNVTNGKVTRKGIGRLDGRTYVCNDPDIITQAQMQQYKHPFRKGLRFFVTDKRIHLIKEENTKETHHLAEHALLIMGRTNVNSVIPQAFQLHHSKQIIHCDIQYDKIKHFPNEWDYRVKVKPANILSIHDAKYHRYFNTVLVCNGEISKRELYSIMKNSVNLTICTIKGERTK